MVRRADGGVPLSGPDLLSVIVPVYNERTTVGEILRRMRQVELDVDREIIVVDDGSTDGTDKVLATLEDSTVRLVKHPVNRGKGAAIRSGAAVARGDLILIQDADLEYSPAEWPRLLAPIRAGRSQVVFGSRYIGEREPGPVGQWLADRFLAVLCAVLYNRTVSDVKTGYKLFDRSVFDELDLKSDGFEIEAEITAKLLRRGRRILEVPITYAGRAGAEGRKFTWGDNLRSGLTLVRLRFGR